MPGLSTAEIAASLSKSESWVKAQQRLLNIPRKIVGGKAVWPDNVIDIFKTVASLSEAGAGLSTIRKRISGDSPQSAPSEAQPAPDISQIIPAITQAVTASIAQQTELAEKYARAAHQIGQHEERERQLVAAIEELREQVRLLQAPKPEPEAKEEKPRSWWGKLLG
jgi:hypothetical protein